MNYDDRDILHHATHHMFGTPDPTPILSDCGGSWGGQPGSVGAGTMFQSNYMSNMTSHGHAFFR
jgi:hypothetical protein